MKAVILAAGKGERLKEITKSIPKPMIKFKGKPILEHNIDLCKTYGIKEIFINTSHLAEKIMDYFGDGSKFGVSIKYTYEKKLLGTSGALNNFKNDLIQEPFFVIYGDNYSEFNLVSLKKKFLSLETIGVIGCHYRKDISNSGFVVVNEQDRILSFVEKPKNELTVISRCVNAGYYYLSSSIFNFIPEGFSDFSYDIFPSLIKSGQVLHAVISDVDLRSFDTPEMLKNSFNR